MHIVPYYPRIRLEIQVRIIPYYPCQNPPPTHLPYYPYGRPLFGHSQHTPFGGVGIYPSPWGAGVVSLAKTVIVGLPRLAIRGSSGCSKKFQNQKTAKKEGGLVLAVGTPAQKKLQKKLSIQKMGGQFGHLGDGGVATCSVQPHPGLLRIALGYDFRSRHQSQKGATWLFSWGCFLLSFTVGVNPCTELRVFIQVSVF